MSSIHNDPVIDKSPMQKRLRVNKLRAELIELGYSVVTTEWLHSILGEQIAKVLMMEARA